MKKFSVAVLFLFFAAAHVGCVATNSIRELNKDKSIPSSRAVVFWKLRITDRSKTLAHNSAEITPMLGIKRLDVDNYGSCHAVSPCPVHKKQSGQPAENGWMKTKDSDRFDQLMAISLDPGRYHMRSLYFKIGQGTISSGIRGLSIPVNRVFRTRPGQSYYLGSLNVDIDSYANGVFHYSIAIDADRSRQTDIKQFTSSFPELSGAFGNPPVLNRPLAYFHYDFSYDIKTFPEFIRTDEVLAEINLEKKSRSYIVRRFAEDEGYHFIMGKRAHGLASNDSFTIEWESRWVDGVDHLPYGLLLGPDPQDAYYFSVSGNEKSAVFLKKKDVWLNPPCDWKKGASRAGDGININRHKVEFSRNRIAYRVNDKNIAEFDNSLKFDSFVIGLFVAGKESVVFDNIIIEQTAAPSRD